MGGGGGGGGASVNLVILSLSEFIHSLSIEIIQLNLSKTDTQK